MSEQFKNSIFTTFFGVLGLLIHFAQQSLLARLIEPTEYAIFLSLGSLLFLSVFFNCLMPLLVVKRLTVLTDNLPEASTYFSVYWKILNWISLFCFIFLIVILPLVQEFLRIPVPNGILITYVYLITIIYFAFYTAALQSFGKFRLIATLQLIQAVIRLAAVILPAFFIKSNHQVAAAGLLASVVLTNVLLSYYCKRDLGLKKVALSFKEIKEKVTSLKDDAKYALYTSLMYSFIILFNSFDIPLSRFLFSEAQNVPFAPLTSLSKLCYSVPAMIIGVYFPTFIKAHHQGKNGFKELTQALGLTFVLALGITVVLNFDTNLIVSIVFGSRYSGAEGTLIFTCFSMTFLSLINVVAHYYIAFERFSILVLLLLFFGIQVLALILPQGLDLLRYVQIEMLVFAGLFLASVLGVKFFSEKGKEANLYAKT